MRSARADDGKHRDRSRPPVAVRLAPKPRPKGSERALGTLNVRRMARIRRSTGSPLSQGRANQGRPRRGAANESRTASRTSGGLNGSTVAPSPRRASAASETARRIAGAEGKYPSSAYVATPSPATDTADGSPIGTGSNERIETIWAGGHQNRHGERQVLDAAGHRARLGPLPWKTRVTRLAAITQSRKSPSLSVSARGCRSSGRAGGCSPGVGAQTKGRATRGNECSFATAGPTR